MGKAACGEGIMEGVHRQHIGRLCFTVCVQTDGSVWREEYDTRGLRRKSI